MSMKQVNPASFNIPLMASPSFPPPKEELVNVKKAWSKTVSF